MSDPNQEIKDLLLALDKKLDGFDRKFETQITELKIEIRLVKTELHAKIDLTRNELESKIDLAQSGLEGKIAELSGKMDGYGKRLDQQKFISRGAIVALVVGVAPGFIKYSVFLLLIWASFLDSALNSPVVM
ncbi:hypothetical protein L1047_15155 [Synechococcus sp. Nb3U1]|uniref:hypothetical protein n=1 Tax=Synechococcus sp. Nb3U1 TaxID=1914529 RepID=UPI001F16C74D|nr:hypothetical protein [Synechococcus sp. Nb3U1]MCF2972532.1 hypothetical protein [Synechococcus sp. Nb3U1]